jgi:hypothetical protein
LESLSELPRSTQNDAIPVLEGLGLSILHDDLRPHLNLLRGSHVGIQICDVSHLNAALTRSGMDKRVEKTAWPKCLQVANGLDSLWREAVRLLERKHNQPHGLNEKAVALGRDGSLWPCCDIFRADEQTRDLFQRIDPGIPFLADLSPEFATISQLSHVFDAEAAIQRLARLGTDGIRKALEAQALNVCELLLWFQERESEVRRKPQLAEQLRQLPIFPCSGGTRSLPGLSLPGDFTDPLGLAALVDLSAFSERREVLREFLRYLGAQELNFQNYASQHLPPALARPDLPAERRRQVALLLASRRSEIVDDQDIRGKLVKAAIVECQDSVFRSPHQVYFGSDSVTAVLGGEAALASLPVGHEAAVREFYAWLGVADNPRFDDIVNRVQRLVAQSPTPGTAQAVRAIFTHLGERLR